MPPLSTLVQEIHSFAAHDSEQMLASYQRYVQKLLNAEKVTWYAAYRGDYGRELWQTRVMDNWKVVDITFPIGMKRNRIEEMKAYFKKAQEENAVDPQVELAITGAGRTRVDLLSDAVAPEDWQNHWMHDHLEKQGVGERMVGAFHLADDSESYVLVDRAINDAPFGEQGRQLLYDALISFPRLHYWLFLERGLVTPAQRPFSPRERDVLRMLLAPGSEEDIADQLKLSKGTVQTMLVTSIKI